MPKSPKVKFHKLPLSKEYVWFSHGQEYWRPCNSQKYFWLSHDKKKSKLPKVYKVQVTQGIQSPSFPKCQKHKSLKVQVTQSPSFPKSKLPKVSKVQVTQGVQSPSCQNCSKSKLPKVQITQSPSCLKSKLPQSKPVKNSYGTPIPKGIYGPIMVQNIYFQPLNLSINTINL